MPEPLVVFKYSSISPRRAAKAGDAVRPRRESRRTSGSKARMRFTASGFTNCSASRSEIDGRRMPYFFSSDRSRMRCLLATAAERARKSIGVFKRYMEEFAEFECPAIAKIGYETDSGKGREHLWFTVHGVGRDDLDATLESSPHDIARMKKGQRERQK